jgi:ankyrin repeat protein
MNNSINNIILGSCLLGGFITTLPQLQASWYLTDQRQPIPLHNAALNGNIERVHALLEQGDDPNEKNTEGETPLHLAAWRGKPDVTQALINAKANVNEIDNNEETPLHRACAAVWGDEDTIVLLVQNGANVNAIDKNGLTPLHNAAFRRRSDIIQILINAEANVNTRSLLGSTPLHLAVSYPKIIYYGLEAIKTLLENGANLNIPDDRNETPVQCAERYLGYVTEAPKAGITIINESVIYREKICSLLREYTPQPQE